MSRIAEMIIKHRVRILAGALILCAFCGLLALKVPINADMTKYLPDSSSMKQGIDLMAEEFSSLQMPSTIRVMLRLQAEGEADGKEGTSESENNAGIRSLSGTEEAAFLEKLSSLDYVSGVSKTDEKEQNGSRYVLFTVNTGYDYQTPEEFALEAGILSLRKEGFDLEMVNDNMAGLPIPLPVYATAVVILMIILFVMCASWVEPFLFLATIGIAIVLNLGTNIILGSVSQTTYSMSAVLQLVLSMDYSVILMNRYRQEKARALQVGELRAGMDPPHRRAVLSQVMCTAWKGAFSSVASSSLTTFVGLIMLVFMRFKIGKDLGLVLAKGVLLSMLCVLTVLPALILLFDDLIEKSAKKVLYIPTGALARFSFRMRWGLTIGFVLLFGIFRYTQSRAGISYAISPKDPIAEVFTPSNPIVLLYDNKDERAAGELAVELETEEGITQVFSYGNVLGRRMKPGEMADFIKEMTGGSFASYLNMGNTSGRMQTEAAPAPEGSRKQGQTEERADSQAQLQDVRNMLSEESLTALFGVYALINGGNESGTLSIEQVFDFVGGNLDNPLLGAFLSAETKELVREYAGVLTSAKEMLTGPTHSLMMIATELPVEAPETETFIRMLQGKLSERMSGTYYLIGNSPMNVEMKDSFGDELFLITLLTALAIFIVVAVTFRQLVIPVILVALVQCGVYMSITTVWLLGYQMYYLAILIVQCILMGATVDYAILMTGYYREIRGHIKREDALRETYEKSVHTVLTSGLFMILVTGAIGISPVDPTISQICQSISLGALSATLLVLFVLPGMLAALDRFVLRKH